MMALDEKSEDYQSYYFVQFIGSGEVNVSRKMYLNLLKTFHSKPNVITK